MNCWHCGAKLIWDSDVDMEGVLYDEDNGILTFLHCSECPAFYQVFLPEEEEEQ